MEYAVLTIILGLLLYFSTKLQSNADPEPEAPYTPLSQVKEARDHQMNAGLVAGLLVGALFLGLAFIDKTLFMVVGSFLVYAIGMILCGALFGYALVKMTFRG